MKVGRIGRVVQIRVNTKDCMAVVDVLRQTGLLPPGMSFAQGVSIALSSAMESLRQAKVIPTRDGFEYNELMEHFPADRPVDRARKLDITKAVHESEYAAPSLLPESPEQKRKKLRFEELKFRVAQDIANVSEAELVEYSELSNEFTPL